MARSSDVALASSRHFVHAPPLQVHAEPSAQVTVQSPFGHEKLQVAPVAQLMLHLPPAQVPVQLLPVVHMYWQPPCGQA